MKTPIIDNETRDAIHSQSPSRNMRWMYPLLMAASMTCACGDDGDDGGEVGADAAIEESAAPHQVYLVFDGLTLSTGSIDDPAENISRILVAPFTAPPFFGDESNRVEKLALIADGARTILAAYNIEVVTERPATGDYDMIVLGGQSEDAGLQPGRLDDIPFGCNAVFALAKNVSFIFETGMPETKRYASTIVTSVGIINGIPITNLAGDCLCHPGDCKLIDALCTMGGPGTPVNTNVWGVCSDITEVDVHARFLDQFGPAL